MFAQHPGNQGKEGGVDGEKETRKEETRKITLQQSQSAVPLYGCMFLL